MPAYSPRYQPGWDQPPQPHEAGGSGWQSASSVEWEQGWQFHHTSSSSSGPLILGARRSLSARRRNDIADLTSRVNDLDVRTGDIQNVLNTHVQNFASFEQRVDTQYNALLQSTNADLQAYFRSQGFNPRHQQ